MFVAKKALSRRTFLRGAGTVVALPLLDAMIPALSAAPPPAPRLGFVYISNGVIQKQFEFAGILKPLEPLKDYVNVLSGLSHLQADTMGDGNGDHPRASAVWLSGVHAYDRTKPGVELRLATTADQLAAQAIGKGTRLSSLETNLDITTQGSCDTGDCFFINTISWRNATTPNPAEFHPRIVFERLFGDGGTTAQRLAQTKTTGSILDSIIQEVDDIARTLGAGDTTKLTEYLDSIREIERRIQNSEAEASQSVDLPERPVDVPASFDEHARLMFDLHTLAFQADVTRVFTMILAREVSVRTYANIGVPEQHHSVSHHRNDAGLITKKARIDTYHAELFSYFVKKLQATPDGDGSLLDHSLIMYGGGMGDGNLHRHSDLPCVLAGRLGGAFKTGRHIAYPQDTPMANLLLTILDSFGVHQQKLGDSTGRLQI